MEKIKFIDGTEALLMVRCEECKYNSICSHSVQYTTHDAHSVTIESKTVEWCSCGDREDEPKTQMKTQNSNLTFEKDECAKEYEELGLKELKELIESDRKDEPQTDCAWK